MKLTTALTCVLAALIVPFSLSAQYDPKHRPVLSGPDGQHTAVRSSQGASPETGESTGYRVLYTFTGGSDGGVPNGGELILDPEGNLYGTTFQGGDLTSPNADCPVNYGCGVVFKVDKAGKQSVLHAFTGGSDGAMPFLGVIRDEVGNIYGTTAYGGSGGAGVVFKLDRSGKETILYNFTGGEDGGSPYGLLRDIAGNLYGSAFSGGAYGAGVVYKLDRSGDETVLYTFTGGADGGSPNNLSWDVDGGFVASTTDGGNLTECSGEGCGVVFKLDRKGNETVLYTFTDGADGAFPYTNVIPDRVGNLYGAASSGGDLGACNGSGCGVIFKLDRSGKQTVLHTFTGGADGGYASADLLRDEEDNLFSTTFYGGVNPGTCPLIMGCGVVFKLDRIGKETVLYNFAGGAMGGNSDVGLVRDREGNLYGMTELGGDFSDSPSCTYLGCGVVYKLSNPCDHPNAADTN